MANDKLAALMDLMPLQGILQKSSSGMSKKWTKKFFQQKDMKLLMYNSEAELDQPQGEIDLETVTAVTRGHDPKKPQFTITTPKKTYILLASSMEEVYFWVDRLSSLIAKNSAPRKSSDPTSPGHSSVPIPISSPTTSPPIGIPLSSSASSHEPPAVAPRRAVAPRGPSNMSSSVPSNASTPISPRGDNPIVREPAPVPPSHVSSPGIARPPDSTAKAKTGAKSAIYGAGGRDQPPVPSRIGGSTLNVRAPAAAGVAAASAANAANAPSAASAASAPSAASPASPATASTASTASTAPGANTSSTSVPRPVMPRNNPAGSSINVRSPPPTAPSREHSTINVASPSVASPAASSPTISTVNNEELDGASTKFGKPPPPKRLPPKPPGDESESADAPNGSPPSSPPSTPVPRPTLPTSKSAKDQTKKQLPPTPGAKSGTAESTDGEGANEEPLSQSDLEAMIEKRSHIIKEIVATEQTYVNNLNIALKKYMTPLLESCGPKDKDGVKRKEDVISMFSNMEIIYGLNSELLKSLQEVTECDSSSPKYLMVGDVFGRFTPFLKMYQQYSVGYEHAMEIFNKWGKDTVCQNLLKACNESTGTNLKLDHYLIFPIQRIPRYNLLLQDLVRNTPDGHPDKAKIRDALENNKKVAERITLLQADNARKIVSAVAIDGLEQLMAPARYLIHHEKVEASRLDISKFDFSRVTDIAKARASQKEKLQIFLFNNLFAVREDKVSLFSGSSQTRANWVLPLQLWLKEDPGLDTGLLFLGPHEGFYVNFPQAETRTAWIESVAELSVGVDGYREFEYLSGDDRLYTGRWFAGKFDGTGTLFFYGNVYTGEWFGGLKQGTGKLAYATGDVYEGQWDNDLMNGEGTITYAAGHTYVGEWRDGKRTGKGEMTFAEGRKYDGRWKDDMAYGVGIYTGGGITYDGNWLNGKMHGKGTLEHPMYTYSGFFAKGKREGTGTCEWKDGTKYEGNWRDDKRYGMGKFTCDSYAYDGEWANDKMEGKGKAEYPWGTYKGEWAQGSKCGKGFLSYPSGYSYEGSFKNDMFNGAGTLIYPNGYKWEGKFQNGVPDGKGTVVINAPNSNHNPRKTSFVAVLKDRELILTVGKDEVKCQFPPEVPVFELDI